MYFIRLGILDGKAGWHLAMLMVSYEYMIGLLHRQKLQQWRRQRAEAATPEAQHSLEPRRSG